MSLWLREQAGGCSEETWIFRYWQPGTGDYRYTFPASFLSVCIFSGFKTVYWVYNQTVSVSRWCTGLELELPLIK